jgi:hypothetical protein
MIKYDPLEDRGSVMKPEYKVDMVLLSIWKTRCNDPQLHLVLWKPGDTNCILYQTKNPTSFLKCHYCDLSAHFDEAEAKRQVLQLHIVLQLYDSFIYLLVLFQRVYRQWRIAQQWHFIDNLGVDADCKNPIPAIRKAKEAKALLEQRKQESTKKDVVVVDGRSSRRRSSATADRQENNQDVPHREPPEQHNANKKKKSTSKQIVKNLSFEPSGPLGNDGKRSSTILSIYE